MCPHPPRLVVLLCLALLVAPLPAATPAARAVSAASASIAGPGDLPLGWATYLGGKSDDQAAAIAADGAGDLYVAGGTASRDFPVTPSAAPPHFGDIFTAFVASYAASGRLRWVGGSGLDEILGVTTDGQGNVYVTGSTIDALPVTPGAAQPHTGGGAAQDAFVASYTSGGGLRWATYLGGSGDDDGDGIAADGQGNVYVTGSSSSPDFPATPGAAQPHLAGRRNALVASYTPAGRLRWATYLGGSGYDEGTAIGVDAHGDVYITGRTGSPNFPVTPGAAQPHTGGGFSNAFVASFAPGGGLRWATYLGGKGSDQGRAITIDRQGTVYVAGSTTSPDFPATAGAAQLHSGDPTQGDAFVASYASGGGLRWATYLGGSGYDEGDGIAADRQGKVYVTGSSNSPDFPVGPGATRPHLGSHDGDNAFLAAYGGSGELRWTTYLGGAGYHGDDGRGIAVGGQGNVYVTGSTQSPEFPVTPGAAQSAYRGGGYDVFVARLIVPAGRPAALDPASPPPPGTPHTRYFPATHHTLAGAFLATWDRVGGIPTLGLPLSEPFTLAGQQVQVTERAVLALTGGRVSLLPLGRLLSAARSFAPVAPGPSTAYRLYFPSTGHTLSGPFLAYWQAHQGSALLGPPIAEPDREGLGDGTGRVYLVQWFANGRLELHPEVEDARYRVEQGRVGYEYLHRAGLL